MRKTRATHYPVHLGVRLSPAEHEELERHCQAYAMTKSQFVRRAVKALPLVLQAAWEPGETAVMELETTE